VEYKNKEAVLDMHKHPYGVVTSCTEVANKDKDTARMVVAVGKGRRRTEERKVHMAGEDKDTFVGMEVLEARASSAKSMLK